MSFLIIVFPKSYSLYIHPYESCDSMKVSVLKEQSTRFLARELSLASCFILLTRFTRFFGGAKESGQFSAPEKLVQAPPRAVFFRY